jgi:hypothetical protein
MNIVYLIFLVVIRLEASCCREGFDESRIESVLHSVELSLKHETSNFGLNLVSVSQSAVVFFETCNYFFPSLVRWLSSHCCILLFLVFNASMESWS